MNLCSCLTASKCGSWYANKFVLKCKVTTYTSYLWYEHLLYLCDSCCHFSFSYVRGTSCFNIHVQRILQMFPFLATRISQFIFLIKNTNNIYKNQINTQPTLSLFLTEPFPSMVILVPVSPCILFKVIPFGPRSFPTKLY